MAQPSAVDRRAGPVDLDAYRRYMVGRGYASTTVWARLAIARDWVGRHPDLDVASHGDVEAWTVDRGVTAAAVRNLIVNLKAFYRWAQREGYASRDPTSLVDRPRIPVGLPRPAPERAIARVFAVGDVRLRALVALMACAGLRCVECSRLDWVDVDLAAATVIVVGKGRRERLIDLSLDVVRALAALRLSSSDTSGAVFVGVRGVRLSPYRVSQMVNRAFRAQGSMVTAHQLRHRCATMALQQPGVDLLAVRDLLGHASVSTTQIYTAVVPGRTAAASRNLSIPAAS